MDDLPTGPQRDASLIQFGTYYAPVSLCGVVLLNSGSSSAKPRPRPHQPIQRGQLVAGHLAVTGEATRSLEDLCFGKAR